MIHRIALTSGILGLVGGLALFAFSAGFHHSSAAYGQEGTATAVGTATAGDDGTGTPSATRTAGPLTPVSTPTSGSAASPTSGASGLPSTGDGTASGGASGLAIAGIMVAVAGGTLAFLGARRRTI